MVQIKGVSIKFLVDAAHSGTERLSLDNQIFFICDFST